MTVSRTPSDPLLIFDVPPSLPSVGCFESEDEGDGEAGAGLSAFPSYTGSDLHVRVKYSSEC